MSPEWFDVMSLPLDQMRDDERYWLPRVMAGERLAGVITYDDACKRVSSEELSTAGGQGRFSIIKHPAMGDCSLRC